MPDRMHIDPEVGIPDLIRRLGDDSKRLVEDEVQLAKLELKENARRAGRGAVWLAMAFGLGVVALIAFTIFLSTLIGRAVNGHMWVGAIVTGIIELAVAIVLLKRGITALKEPPYDLHDTRQSVKATARWVAHPRT